MTFKKQLLGVISSFLLVGTIVSASSESAYQSVYEAHEKEALRIEKAIDSEFITLTDKQDLSNKVSEFNQVKNYKTRAELKKIINSEKQQVAKVEEKLVEKEKKIASKEYDYLKIDIEDLEKKSKEAFVLGSDSDETAQLKKEIIRLTDIETVHSIRELSSQVSELDKKLANNQAKAKELVNQLTELNKTNNKLAKNEYLLASDKKELGNDLKKNSVYFKDADDLTVLEARFSESSQVLEVVQTNIKETEKDFKENEKDVKTLIGQVKTLVEEGDLTKEEIASIDKHMSSLIDRLDLKDYQAGDLKRHQAALRADYEDYGKLSKERIEKARKIAEKEAKEQQKREEEAQKKAAQEAQRQAQQNQNNQSVEQPTVNGEWTQAPSGHRYLKVESGKTYRQVKNPNNFQLITDEEAASYSPGHGNGSAKQ
ncbi:hypothetical protein [Vagococcus fluvialis]|uniref:hypothetical protein n=1 Tax=Vagococcus fluvialis TaxID=2738 RepID=UPI003B59D1F5